MPQRGRGQPADIVSDFHQRGRQAFQRAVGMDQGIHSGQRFEFVRRGDKWLSAERRQLGRHPYGIFRMGIQPGSYRRPAQRQLGKMRLISTCASGYGPASPPSRRSPGLR